jgi:hypothetical protein
MVENEPAWTQNPPGVKTLGDAAGVAGVAAREEMLGVLAGLAAGV